MEIPHRAFERRATSIQQTTVDRESASPPLWRGDHTFSADAAAYSLMHFIEPAVSDEHPQWDKKTVHEYATAVFSKRLAQDLSYEGKEQRHDETSVVWRPVLTKEGKLELATEYGDGMITLRELWDHTREFAEAIGNPLAYNHEEAAQQLSMQEAFLSGATEAYVSVLSHPDAVRYVQIWEASSEGTVVTKQLDLYKTTGRDFSVEEGEALIHHIRSMYQPDQPIRSEPDAYAHVVISRGSVDEDGIRVLATALTMSTMINPLPIPTDVHTDRIRVREGIAVLRDTKHDMRQQKQDENSVGKKRARKHHRAEPTVVHEKKWGRTKKLQEQRVGPTMEERFVEHPFFVPVMLSVGTDTPGFSHVVIEWLVRESFVKKDVASKEQVKNPASLNAVGEKKDTQQVPPDAQHVPSLSVDFTLLSRSVVDRMTQLPWVKKQGEHILSVVRRVSEKVRESIPRASHRVGIFLRKKLEVVSFEHLSFVIGRVVDATGLRSIVRLLTREKRQQQNAIPDRVDAVSASRAVIWLFRLFVRTNKPIVSRKRLESSDFALQKQQVDTISSSTLFVLLALVRYLALMKESAKPTQQTKQRGSRAKRKRIRSLIFVLAS